MPKKVEREAQRRMIACAAVDVIHDRGLERTRLRDVAKRAHVTTGAVTHYFDGKEAVLEAAMEEVVSRTLRRMAERPERPIVSDVPRFIRGVCRFLPTSQPTVAEWRVWIAFWGRAIADPRLRAIHHRYYREIVDRLSVSLNNLAEPVKRLTPATLRQQADSLLAAVDGVGTRAALEIEQWPAKRQRQTLTLIMTPLLEAFVQSAMSATSEGEP